MAKRSYQLRFVFVVLEWMIHFPLSKCTPPTSFTINGTGGTFPKDVYSQWGYLYPVANVARGVKLNMIYNALGSGVGKSSITNQLSTYGASDAFLSSAEMNASKGELRMVPMLAGSIAVIYQIPGISNLTLSREALVGIFNGTISNWGHPKLLALNPSLASTFNISSPPNITIVVRADSSGSTEIFTSSLSAMDPHWNASYGLYSAPTGWPSSLPSLIKQTGTSAVCLKVLKTSYSIGYAEVSTAKLYLANYASIINKQGTPTLPSDPNALQSAIVDYSNAYVSLPITNFVFRIVDGPGVATYPIVGFTYLIFKLDWPPDCGLAYEVIRYFLWGMTSSDASGVAQTNYFHSIPAQMQPYEYPILQQYLCQDGTPLFNRAVSDIKAEQSGLYSDMLINGVAVVAACIILGILLAILQWALEWKQRSATKSSSGGAGRKQANLDLLEVHRSFVLEKQTSKRNIFIGLGMEMVQEASLAACNWATFMVFPSMSSLQMIFAAFAGVHTAFVFLGLFSKMYTVIKNVIELSRESGDTSSQRESSLAKSKVGKFTSSDQLEGAAAQNTGIMDVGSIVDALKKLRRRIFGEFLCLVSMALGELPLTIMTFVTMFMFPYCSFLVRLCFCWNLFSAGFKIRSTAPFFSALRLYSKGSSLVGRMSGNMASGG